MELKNFIQKNKSNLIIITIAKFEDFDCEKPFVESLEIIIHDTSMYKYIVFDEWRTNWIDGRELFEDMLCKKYEADLEEISNSQLTKILCEYGSNGCLFQF